MGLSKDPMLRVFDENPSAVAAHILHQPSPLLLGRTIAPSPFCFQ
jgi:hypothetical protein